MSNSETNARRYNLRVIQQPHKARMCGFKDDKRPLDPPPILQLTYSKVGNKRDEEVVTDLYAYLPYMLGR